MLDRIGRLDERRSKESPRIKMPGMPLSLRTPRMPFAVSACSRAVEGDPACGLQASHVEAALGMLGATEISRNALVRQEVLVRSGSSDRWCWRGRG